MKGISILENDYLGLIAIIEERDGISAVEFLRDNKERLALLKNTGESELTRECKKQLEEYFSGKRKEFNIKLDITGTDFQMAAWKAMQKIPYGTTISYSEEAKIIGNERAVRAVGLANGRNRIPVIIPCHRVIGKNGKLRGYTGGIDIKKYLLELEKKYM